MSKRKSDASPAGIPQQVKQLKEEVGPFQTKGEFQDEVTLLFEDEKTLFVPATFLKMSSPVFKTMLESDFKEKSTGVIKFSNKKRDDFLQFLEILHPVVDKHVTETNVHTILPIAHEYEMTAIITTCRNTLSSIILKLSMKYEAEIKKNKTIPQHWYGWQLSLDKDTSLNVLLLADKYNFTELKKSAITLMENFGSAHYEDSPLFSSLSDKVKLELLSARLKKCDNDP